MKRWKFVLALMCLVIVSGLLNVVAFADPIPPPSFGGAGEGLGQLNRPLGVAVNSADGKVYVADTNNFRVQVFNSVGEMPAIFKKFENQSFHGTNRVYKRRWVENVAVDESVGGIYVLYHFYNENENVKDSYGFKRFSLSGEEFYDISGLNKPYGIAIKGEYVYIADSGNNNIKKYNKLDGSIVRQWGNEGTGLGQFRNPCGIALDEMGNIYVADTNNNRIQKFDVNGENPVVFGGEGGEDGQFRYPSDLAIDRDGTIWIADKDNNRIQKLNANGGFIQKWGGIEQGAASGQFNKPSGIAINPISKVVYVADTENNRIERILPASFISITNPIDMTQMGSDAVSISWTASPDITNTKIEYAESEGWVGQPNWQIIASYLTSSQHYFDWHYTVTRPTLLMLKVSDADHPEVFNQVRFYPKVIAQSSPQPSSRTSGQYRRSDQRSIDKALTKVATRGAFQRP